MTMLGNSGFSGESISRSHFSPLVDDLIGPVLPAPRFKRFLHLTSPVLVSLILILLSSTNYLLFHCAAETFSFVVAFGIFTVYWHIRGPLQKPFYSLVSIAYFFVGVLDVLHMLAFPGMGVFAAGSTNLAAQLWIVARYLESFSILFALLYPIHGQLPLKVVFGVYFLIFVGAVVSILVWPVFPMAFVEGVGLTHFKVYSEYLISLGWLASFVVIGRKKSQFPKQTYRYFRLALLMATVMEVIFTFYRHAYSPVNMFGHILKVSSFYAIYLGFVQTAIKQPFAVLRNNLRKREEELEAALGRLTSLNQHLEEKVAERTVELTTNKRQLQNLVVELGEAEQRERQRIAQVLHDDLQQILAAIRLRVGTIRKNADEPGVREKMQYVENLVDHAVELSRNLTNNLVPPIVRDSPLVEVLHWLSVQAKSLYDLDVTVKSDGIADVENIELKGFVFQVVRELLFNVIKHARVRQATVTLTQDHQTGEIVIVVADRGQGFEVAKLSKSSARNTGFGLESLRSRFELMNAGFTLESTPGEGTKVTIRIKPQVTFES